MAVALKDLCVSHRSDHTALGAGAPYIPPTDAEMLTWRSGRVAAAGVAAVLPDEVLNEAYTDYLGGHDLLCTRYKIAAAAAKAVQKRTATKHINTALQKALLVAIEKEVKLKHFSDIPDVVENEQKFSVISVAESNFVMKLSLIALFLQMSTIIRSEVKAVAGATRTLFMTPYIFFWSLVSHITAIQPGFDLLRSYHFASVDDLLAWLAVMSRINFPQEAATSTKLPAQLSAVYLDVFDKLSADMFNNPAPFTLERLTPIVKLARKMAEMDFSDG